MIFNKKIHSIWWQKNTEPMPPHIQSIVDSTKKGNPDCEYIIWGMEECIKLVFDHFPDLYEYFVSLPLSSNEDSFRQVRHVDFARLFILEIFGGAYIDTDMEFYGSISSVIEAEYAFISAVDDVNEMVFDRVENPININTRMVNFYDFARYDRPDRKGVMNGCIIYQQRSGILESFVRSRVGKENERVLSFLGPCGFAEFMDGPLSHKFRNYTVTLPRSYVDWGNGKDVRDRPEWNIGAHRALGSWCDKDLEQPWLSH
jgi:hypothetical protein